MDVNSDNFLSENGVNWKRCSCGQDYFDSDKFSSCFECAMKKKGFIKCRACKKGWHDPKYPICYKCSHEAED